MGGGDGGKRGMDLRRQSTDVCRDEDDHSGLFQHKGPKHSPFFYKHANNSKHPSLCVCGIVQVFSRSSKVYMFG